MPRYPEIRAGQRITGEMLTGLQFEEIVKQAATIRAGTTTLDTDPDLAFNLEPNATYHAEFFIQYLTDGTAKIKIAWETPSGATGLRRRIGGDGGETASSGGGTFPSMALGPHSFASEVQYGPRSGNGQSWAYESGTITTSSGGTLALSWAQVTSTGFSTEVSADSYARIKRVA